VVLAQLHGDFIIKTTPNNYQACIFQVGASLKMLPINGVILRFIENHEHVCVGAQNIVLDE